MEKNPAYTIPAAMLEAETETELNEDCVFCMDANGNLVREEVPDDATDDCAQ